VGRIHEAGASTGLDGALRLQRGHFGAFESDAGDDRNLPVHRFDEALDDGSLFVGCEKGSLARVTENDEASDAGMLPSQEPSRWMAA
jgi:hypothetical protein